MITLSKQTNKQLSHTQSNIEIERTKDRDANRQPGTNGTAEHNQRNQRHRKQTTLTEELICSKAGRRQDQTKRATAQIISSTGILLRLN